MTGEVYIHFTIMISNERQCNSLTFAIKLLCCSYHSIDCCHGDFSEQEILREEINCLQVVKDKLKKRITDLEEEVKKTKEELEKEKLKSNPQEAEEVCVNSNSFINP